MSKENEKFTRTTRTVNKNSFDRMVESIVQRKREVSWKVRVPDRNSPSTVKVTTYRIGIGFCNRRHSHARLNSFARNVRQQGIAWLPRKPPTNYIESSRFEKSRTTVPQRLAWDSLIVRQTRAVRRNIVNSRSTQYPRRLHLHTYTSRRRCKLHALTLRYRKLYASRGPLSWFAPRQRIHDAYLDDWSISISR